METSILFWTRIQTESNGECHDLKQRDAIVPGELGVYHCMFVFIQFQFLCCHIYAHDYLLITSCMWSQLCTRLLIYHVVHIEITLDAILQKLLFPIWSLSCLACFESLLLIVSICSTQRSASALGTTNAVEGLVSVRDCAHKACWCEL